MSYGCQACSFFVNENGVGPETLGGPGILLRMEEAKPANERPAVTAVSAVSGDLTLTCRARECWATQVSAWEAGPSARFKFDVAKFDMPVSNFSQVLIIVSR